MLPRELPSGGQRLCDAFSHDIAEDTDENDAQQRTEAVNKHILYRGAATDHKELVQLVERREAYAEDSGGQDNPDSPYAIDVDRDGDGHGEQEVFGDMCELPDIIMDFADSVIDLFGRKLQIQQVVNGGYKIMGYAVAQFGAGGAVLRRK